MQTPILFERISIVVKNNHLFSIELNYFRIWEDMKKEEAEEKKKNKTKN